MIELKCKKCGKLFHNYPSNKRVYCSIKCRGYAGKRVKPKVKRESNPNWKGGRMRHGNYIMVLLPEHPYASKPWGYIFEHRLIMEDNLGRFLSRDEVVHHVNGIGDDNRLDNLEVMTRREHALYHRVIHETNS